MTLANGCSEVVNLFLEIKLIISSKNVFNVIDKQKNRFENPPMIVSNNCKKVRQNILTKSNQTGFYFCSKSYDRDKLFFAWQQHFVSITNKAQLIPTNLVGKAKISLKLHKVFKLQKFVHSFSCYRSQKY